MIVALALCYTRKSVPGQCCCIAQDFSYSDAVTAASSKIRYNPEHMTTHRTFDSYATPARAKKAKKRKRARARLKLALADFFGKGTLL